MNEMTNPAAADDDLSVVSHTYSATVDGPDVYAALGDPRRVACPTCGELVDIGGDLEDAHMVFAVRRDGTRSNLGWCPNGSRGWDHAVQEAQGTWGRAMYRSRIVVPGVDPRTERWADQPAPETTADEPLYLVCRQCGEAFDSITTAYAHPPRGCGSYQGFDVQPESEAM